MNRKAERKPHPEWIKFVEVDLRDGRKTQVWAVLTLDGATCLGRKNIRPGGNDERT